MLLWNCDFAHQARYKWIQKHSTSVMSAGKSQKTLQRMQQVADVENQKLCFEGCLNQTQPPPACVCDDSNWTVKYLCMNCCVESVLQCDHVGAAWRQVGHSNSKWVEHTLWALLLTDCHVLSRWVSCPQVDVTSVWVCVVVTCRDVGRLVVVQVQKQLWTFIRWTLVIISILQWMSKQFSAWVLRCSHSSNWLHILYDLMWYML